MSQELGKKLPLGKRDIQELHHAIHYAENLAHGTAGHNQLMLIATLAKHIGFELVDGEVIFPDPAETRVVIVESSR